MANGNEHFLGLEMTNSWSSNSSLNFEDLIIINTPPPVENEDGVIPPCVDDNPPVQLEEVGFFGEGGSAPPSAPSGNTLDSVKKRKLYELDENDPNITERERKRIRKAKSCKDFRTKQKEKVKKFLKLKEKDDEIKRLKQEIQSLKDGKNWTQIIFISNMDSLQVLMEEDGWILVAEFPLEVENCVEEANNILINSESAAEVPMNIADIDERAGYPNIILEKLILRTQVEEKDIEIERLNAALREKDEEIKILKHKINLIL